MSRRSFQNMNLVVWNHVSLSHCQTDVGTPIYGLTLFTIHPSAACRQVPWSVLPDVPASVFFGCSPSHQDGCSGLPAQLTVSSLAPFLFILCTVESMFYKMQTRFLLLFCLEFSLGFPWLKGPWMYTAHVLC